MNQIILPDCSTCQGKGYVPWNASDDYDCLARVPCWECCKRWDDAERERTLERTAVLIKYRNHRGEVAWRRIAPLRVWHGSTEWHSEPQWLLRVWDFHKHAERDFAMADILSWPAPSVNEPTGPKDTP